MDESIIYRLVIARSFFEQARGNVRRHDATSLAIAVVNVHDALDNLVGAVAAQLDVHVPENASLLKVFDRIAEGRPLPSRVKVEQLNALRNSVKHHGLHPNPVIVRQLVPELLNLADEIAMRTLGLRLTAVRTTDLIVDPQAKADMVAVAAQIETGEYKNALQQMAFIMFRVYEVYKLMHARLAAFLNAESDRAPVPRVAGEYSDISATELRLDLIELGLDPREYEAFHLVVPRVGLVPGAGDTAYIMTKDRYTWHAANWTRENSDRAFDILLRFILAQQARPTRPAVHFEASLDVVTFKQPSAVYKDASGEAILFRASTGDQVYVQDLPFVENSWQGWGGERAPGLFHLEGQWKRGFINKKDVEVAPYAGEVREA